MAFSFFHKILHLCDTPKKSRGKNLIIVLEYICMIRMILITDKDVLWWKVCYNSQSQDVSNFHAKIVLNEAMFWLKQLMGYDEYVPVLI